MNILNLMGDPLVKSMSGLIVLPIILIIVMIAVVILLERLTRAASEISAKEEWKYWRYDAGNPSRDKEVRKRLSMQYLGFLIIFLAVEPAVIILAIISLARGALLNTMLLLFGLFFVLYVPLTLYAAKESSSEAESLARRIRREVLGVEG